MEILLGFMAGAWLFTVGAGVYVVRYLLYPAWGNTRKDIMALNTKLDNLEQWTKNEIGLRKLQEMSDEERATIERRLSARKRWANG